MSHKFQDGDKGDPDFKDVEYAPIGKDRGLLQKIPLVRRHKPDPDGTIGGLFVDLEEDVAKPKGFSPLERKRIVRFGGIAALILLVALLFHGHLSKGGGTTTGGTEPGQPASNDSDLAEPLFPDDEGHNSAEQPSAEEIEDNQDATELPPEPNGPQEPIDQVSEQTEESQEQMDQPSQEDNNETTEQPPEQNDENHQEQMDQNEEKQEVVQPSGAGVESSQQDADGDNRIIHYLHLHRAEGASHMCDYAKMNLQENEVERERDCHVQIDNKCCGNEDTMEAQRQFATNTMLKFVESKDCLYESIDPEHYRYVVTLRTSIMRYLVQYLEIKKRGIFEQYVPENPDLSFGAWLGRRPDNFFVRQICGQRCVDVPKYGLEQTHWEHAVQRLGLFDSLLFIDRSRPDSFVESYNRFANEVGWEELSEQDSSEDMYRTAYDEVISAEESWDSRMTVMDDALFEYALALHRGDAEPNSQFDITVMVREGETPCEDTCCGVCYPGWSGE